MKWLKQLLQRSAAASDSGLWYAVQCNRCRSIVRVRIDARNDLSLDDDHTGYLVRKTVVDDRCFSRLELLVTFDLQRRQTSASVTGGTLVQEEA